MRRSIAMAVMAVVGLTGTASLAGPGPNGSNNYGLCKAYFSGSETGRANKRKAPPFAALEDVAEEAYDEEHGENEATIEDKVRWWCQQNAPHPSGNGGRGGSPDTGSASAGSARGKSPR